MVNSIPKHLWEEWYFETGHHRKSKWDEVLKVFDVKEKIEK